MYAPQKEPGLPGLHDGVLVIHSTESKREMFAFASCGWVSKDDTRLKEYTAGRCSLFAPKYHAPTTTRALRLKMQSGPEHAESEQEDKEKSPQFKFDPKSEKDAFGRDPRKETEFWMEGAKEVLRSEEVKAAQKSLAAEGNDGLTDEQRAFLEFAKGLSSTPKTSESGSAPESN
jgi:hypothetical protein